MVKDIFKEPLHPIEGVQDFSKRESLSRIKRLKKSDRNDFCTIKEEKPYGMGVMMDGDKLIQFKEKIK